MAKIYVNQSKLRLQVNTGLSATDMLDVVSTKIKYQKPNSTAVYEYDAHIATTVGAIYYDFKVGDLNVAGDWTFWAYVIFTSDRVAPGTPIKIKVWAEGT